MGYAFAGCAGLSFWAKTEGLGNPSGSQHFWEDGVAKCGLTRPSRKQLQRVMPSSRCNRCVRSLAGLHHIGPRIAGAI